MKALRNGDKEAQSICKQELCGYVFIKDLLNPSSLDMQIKKDLKTYQ